MKLTIHGAARQVTGSMFLLELNDGYKVLIDCGVDFESNLSVSFPFLPSEIDLVLLTHAHLDHSGNIPNLYQAGYQGQILCTTPTFELTQLILNDAAALKSKSIKRKLRRKKYGDRKVSDEKSLEAYVQEASDSFVTLAFNKPFEIRPDLKVTFIPAGHLLGAASIYVEVQEEGIWKKIGFSGDIGRKDYPLLRDPEIFPQVDYLICETTYGNRLHEAEKSPEDILLELIKSTCIDISGRLIIPSFSVGRSQALLYSLNKLASEGKLPSVKVFADSPMAAACTEIYEKNLQALNEEAREFYSQNNSLFDFDNLQVITGYKESKSINNYAEPCIILSSSGMITGGRIQEHVRRNLGNYYCSILLVGYCAEGTIGHSLFNGQKVINIKGRSIPVLANIIYTDVFSGHGDQNDLLEFVGYQKKEKLNKIFLVHGDEESMHGFADQLQVKGYTNVLMPEKGDTFEL